MYSIAAQESNLDHFTSFNLAHVQSSESHLHASSPPLATSWCCCCCSCDALQTAENSTLLHSHFSSTSHPIVSPHFIAATVRAGAGLETTWKMTRKKFSIFYFCYAMCKIFHKSHCEKAPILLLLLQDLGERSTPHNQLRERKVDRNGPKSELVVHARDSFSFLVREMLHLSSTESGKS